MIEKSMYNPVTLEEGQKAANALRKFKKIYCKTVHEGNVVYRCGQCIFTYDDTQCLINTFIGMHYREE